MQRLREAGLFVSPPLVPTNAWPHGVWVGKPTSKAVNFIPEHSDGYMTMSEDKPLPPDMNAPMVVFCSSFDEWCVVAQDGGGGPADFINEWGTPEQAISDILAFYFGDP